MHILDNVFTTEHGEAITVLQLITKIKTSIYQVDNILNDYLIRLDAIDVVNNTQNTDILVLKGNVDLLKSQVANIFTTIGDYLLQLQQLDILTQTHSSQITDIQNVNQSQGLQLINLNSKSLEHDLKISGINTRIDIALSAISDLNEVVSSINTTLSTHTTTINNLSIILTDLSTLVNNLQNTCTTLTNDLNALTSRVTYLETNDTWQNEQISSLSTFTQLNTNNISALNTIVGNLDSRIDELEDSGLSSLGCLELDSPNLFENSTTILEPTNVYNLWEYPANVDTDKTLVNIQTSFSTSGDTTQITINTPNGPNSIAPTSFGTIVNPATLNIDFMYKITSGVMEWYGIYTLLIKGKSPIINYFSGSANYPHKENKTYPLENTHLSISFSAATVYLQPHIKITKYKLGG